MKERISARIQSRIDRPTVTQLQQKKDEKKEGRKGNLLGVEEVVEELKQSVFCGVFGDENSSSAIDSCQNTTEA